MIDVENKWLTDTDKICCYDGDNIEYIDPVVLLTVVSPTVDDHGVITMEPNLSDEGDYLYEPAFFHAHNWDLLEEQLQPYLDIHTPVLHRNGIIECSLCRSSINEGETMGLLSFGEIQRSNKCPRGIYEPTFVCSDKDKAPICIECLAFINNEVHTVWPDGVCHDDECQIGTQTRCWRSGCLGNCEEEQE